MKLHFWKHWLVLLLLGIVLAACTTDIPQPSNASSAIGQQMMLLPGHSKPTLVTYEVIDGLAIFEGDIVLGTVSDTGVIEAQGIGIEGSGFRWTNGVVPFVISSSLSSTMQTSINTAIAHWEANTDIDLIPRTTQTAYLEFVTGTGCSSQVGRQGTRQTINLAAGCSTGNIIHEIGHALGLWHEQSREDRDSHVVISSQNIQSGKAHNFTKHISDGFDIGFYDFVSIMHYPCTAFSVNGQNTITPINPPAGVSCTATGTNRIGQRVALSVGDKAAVRTLYPPDPFAGPHSLRVVITGAVTSVPSFPGVVVKSATGQTVTKLTRTTTLSLAAGNYVVTAPTWDVGGPTKPFWRVFFPDASSKSVSLPVSSGTATVTFTYQVEDVLP
jgi:Astacin (Peptidase family M12A)